MPLAIDSDAVKSTLRHNSKDAIHIVGSSAFAEEQVLPWASTIAWDGTMGQVAEVTLTAGAVMGTPTNLQKGCFYHLTVKQDATGARALGWATIFRFAYNAAPVLSGSPLSKDCFSFKYDGTYLLEQGRSMGIP